MYQKLFEIIEKTIVLDASDKKLCMEKFKPREVVKNMILEDLGKQPRHLYFINKGFLRCFYYDDNGNETTTRITGPNAFITDYLSFIHEKSATNIVESITDCELLCISREDLVNLIDSSERFKTFSLIIFEQAIASTSLRANSLATLKAEQRYLQLLETQPEIVQYVPIQYIASYLGMKPESLSRIRRQLLKE